MGWERDEIGDWDWGWIHMDPQRDRRGLVRCFSSVRVWCPLRWISRVLVVSNGQRWMQWMGLERAGRGASISLEDSVGE